MGDAKIAKLVGRLHGGTMTTCGYPRALIGAWLLAVTFATAAAAPTQEPATPVSPTDSPQSDARSVTAALRAARDALNRGRFDQVESVTTPYQADARFVALRARGLIQRGRYKEAEALLRPLAAENATGDAALELGLLEAMLGRRADAARILEAVMSAEGASGEDYARAGRAARALGHFQEANSFFRRATTAAPGDPAINTWWGDLFLDKYNQPDAARSYLAALQADPEWVDAQVGLARATAQDNPPRATAMARQALSINPSSVSAHLLLAELALDSGFRAEASAEVGRALEINPSSLEAHALAAAIAFLEGRTADYDAAIAAALRINPMDGNAYRVVAEQLAHSYRFDEAVAIAQRALATDPDNSRAAADLGIHLLRTGDEAGARRWLDQAFKADPYDVVTYNLLALLDALDGFVTIQQGDLVVRLHPDEAPALREYVPPLAQQALDTMTKRYGFTPKGPILIEVFPKHDDFAVRNVGLPGMIGALGACFGRVVTMDSPRARPPGLFNWGATLWHELAHVITLQMSRQRVPRWLSEGISVWEETRARPEWGRDQDLMFARALERGQVLSVRDLNSGFSNPQLISLAYFEASLLVDYLVSAYGEPALHKLLRAYGDGLDTDAAVKAAYDATLDKLQTGFTQYLDKTFASLRAALRAPEIGEEPTRAQLMALAQQHPGSYPLQMALGERLAAEKDRQGAIAAFERAAALVPRAPGKDSPQARIADIALANGDKARAAQALEALLEVDHTDIEAARLLTTLVAAHPARLEKAWLRVAALDPFDGAAHAALGAFAMARQDQSAAIRWYRIALANNPPDRAATHLNLARAYVLASDPGEAKRHTLYALEIAPAYEPAQELLLKLVEGR